MKIRVLLLTVLLVCCYHGFSQIRATTEKGEKVILFNDGTWKFEEDTDTNVNLEKSISIDPSLVKKTELKQAYYSVSKRLAKYFGEEKGKIRCRSNCSVDSGKVKLGLQWEVYLGDGYRYFGYFKKEQKVVLKSVGGKELELMLTEDLDTEIVEKYNFTALKGAAVLTEEQLNFLMNNPIKSMEVYWKKSPEMYELEDASFFIKMLKEIVSK